MSGLPHSEAMEHHAIRRFKERCGGNLVRTEYWKMCEAIRAGRVPHVAITVDSVRVFKVRADGRSAYAAWNPVLKQIGTFYPDLSWVTCKGGRVEADWARASA